MADETGKTDRELRAAAADTIVRELVSYAVLFAISWALLNRDAVTRAAARLTARPVSPLNARIARETAALRREISAWEHSGTPGPDGPAESLTGPR